MSEPTIKINPAKACDIEFEVSVQGSEVSEPPIVRFVMNGCDDYLCTFECTKVEGVKWSVQIPPLTHFTKTTVPFHVEVIVDGYYFEPAAGTVQLITNPSVKFQPATNAKPTVTTSFTVKQKEDKKPSKAEKKVSEAAAITDQHAPTSDPLSPETEPTQDGESLVELDVTGQYAPSTNNLIPEYDPAFPKGDAKTPQAEFDKNLDPPPEEFDPKKVAASIVKNTIGSAAKPTARGTLFTRDSTGKPVIVGIDSPDVKATKAANAKRVKDILDPRT